VQKFVTDEPTPPHFCLSSLQGGIAELVIMMSSSPEKYSSSSDCRWHAKREIWFIE
jgi:hypothetical protein